MVTRNLILKISLSCAEHVWLVQCCLLLVQCLLGYGANPSLKDDDNKTALDKARERSDPGHQEVVRILENPGKRLCWLLQGGWFMGLRHFALADLQNWCLCMGFGVLAMFGQAVRWS